MLSLIQQYSKGIAGAIAGAIVMWMAKSDVIIDDRLENSLEIVIGAIITFVIVAISPKNKEVK